MYVKRCLYQGGVNLCSNALFFPILNCTLSSNCLISQSTPKCLDSQKANLLKDLEAIARKPYDKGIFAFFFDEEDSFEDDLNHYVSVKLAVLKSSCYVFCGPYRKWNRNWE